MPQTNEKSYSRDANTVLCIDVTGFRVYEYRGYHIEENRIGDYIDSVHVYSISNGHKMGDACSMEEARIMIDSWIWQ